MFVFQMALKIYHNIAQIDELKYHLEKNDCCEVLTNSRDYFLVFSNAFGALDFGQCDRSYKQ